MIKIFFNKKVSETIFMTLEYNLILNMMFSLILNLYITTGMVEMRKGSQVYLILRVSFCWICTNKPNIALISYGKKSASTPSVGKSGNTCRTTYGFTLWCSNSLLWIYPKGTPPTTQKHALAHSSLYYFVFVKY